MKKIISILFAAAMVTLVSCGGKKADLVVGSWKIADMTVGTSKEIPDSMKARYEAYLAELKNQIEEIKKTSSFDFNKDGSLNFKSGGHDNKGTWKITDDGSKLSMTQGGKEDVSDVIELSSSKLVFESVQEGQKTKVTLSK